MSEIIQTSGHSQNDDLGTVLERLHVRVAETLEARLMEEEATDADIRAILSLLKQNQIQVTITPDAVDHTDQLEAARKQAEDERTPFGRQAMGE